MIGILRRKTNETNPIFTIDDVKACINAYSFTKFQVYGVGIDHPDSWRVFVNPSKNFEYFDGQVKIDHSMDKTSADKEISLSLRWARLNNTITLDDYINEITKQYKLKQKKNKRDSYKILSIDNVITNAKKKAYIIKSQIIANHSIYRVLRNNEMFKSSEIVIFSPESGRIAFAVISSKSDIFDNNQKLFERILFSFDCI